MKSNKEAGENSPASREEVQKRQTSSLLLLGVVLRLHLRCRASNFVNFELPNLARFVKYRSTDGVTKNIKFGALMVWRSWPKSRSTGKSVELSLMTKFEAEKKSGFYQADRTEESS